MTTRRRSEPSQKRPKESVAEKYVKNVMAMVRKAAPPPRLIGPRPCQCGSLHTLADPVPVTVSVKQYAGYREVTVAAPSGAVVLVRDVDSSSNNDTGTVGSSGSVTLTIRRGGPTGGPGQNAQVLYHIQWTDANGTHVVLGGA